MNLLARIVTGLVSAFSAVMGLTALLAPENAAQSLGFGTLDAMGLNSIRADVGAFFLAAAIFSGAGLLPGRAQWIHAAALLYALAAAGRLTGVLMAGAPPGVWGAIVIEIILVLLLTGSARIIGRRTGHLQTNPLPTERGNTT